MISKTACGIAIVMGVFSLLNIVAFILCGWWWLSAVTAAFCGYLSWDYWRMWLAHRRQVASIEAQIEQLRRGGG